ARFWRRRWVRLPVTIIRPSVKVFCSVKECGSLSQPASISLGRTYFRQVSASVIVRLIHTSGAFFVSSLPPNSKRVGHAVDGVEPGSDQGDLQDRRVIEAHRSQGLHIISPYGYRVLGELLDIGQHRPVALVQIRRAPITA